MKPNTNYTLSIIAVSPLNYQSHASITRFHTPHLTKEYNESNKTPLEVIMKEGMYKSFKFKKFQVLMQFLDDTIKKFLYSNTNFSVAKRSISSQNIKKKGLQQSTHQTGSSKIKQNKIVNVENISTSTVLDLQQNYSPRAFDPETGQLDETKSHTVQTLSDTLQSIQTGIKDAIVSKALDNKKYLQTEARLEKELAEIKSQLAIEDGPRSEMRDQYRTIESTHHFLDDKKVKAQIAFQKLRDTIVRKNQQIDLWKSEMEDADKKQENSQLIINQFKHKHEVNTLVLRKNILQATDEAIYLDKEAKKLGTEVKKIQMSKTSTLEAIDDVKKKVDDVTGQIDDNLIGRLLCQSNIHQFLKEAISLENQIEKDLEDKWREDQKLLENRYVSVHDQYENANNAYQKAVAAYQAAINSFSLSSNTSQDNQQGQNSGSNGSSNSNNSAKSKRKTRSRRNTKSNESRRDSNDSSNGNGNGTFLYPSIAQDALINNSPPVNTIAPYNISYPFSNQGNPNISHPVVLNTLQSSLPSALMDTKANFYSFSASNNSGTLATQMSNNHSNASNNSNTFINSNSSTNNSPPISTTSISSTKQSLRLEIPSSDGSFSESNAGDILRSPSAFLPSYLMNEDDGQKANLSVETETNNGESAVANEDSKSLIEERTADADSGIKSSGLSMALHQTNPSFTSFISRPSASILSSINHQRSGSSESLSSRISLGSLSNDLSNDIPLENGSMSSNILHHKSSFNHLFPQQNSLHSTVSSSGSIHSFNDVLYHKNKLLLSDETSHDSGGEHLDMDEKSHGKGSSMFSSIFSTLRPKQGRKSIAQSSLTHASSLSDMTSFVGNNSNEESNNNMLRPLGHSSAMNLSSSNISLSNRVRSSSVNSNTGPPHALGESFGSSFISPWKTPPSHSDLISNKNTIISSNLVHPSLSSNDLAGSVSSGLLNSNFAEGQNTNSVWNFPRPNPNNEASSLNSEGVSSNLGAIGASSNFVENKIIGKAIPDLNLWKDKLDELENSPGSTKSNDDSEKCSNVTESSLQSPISNSANKSGRFSRGFSGLFNISSSHRDYSKQQLDNSVDHPTDTSMSSDGNFLLTAPSLNDSQDRLSIGSNGGDTSLKTCSSSSSLSQNIPAPFQQPSPQPSSHKGGLLQKGIRTFSLSKRTPANTGNNLTAQYRESDISDKEKDLDTDLEKDKFKEKKKKKERKREKDDKKDKDTDNDGEGLPGIDEDSISTPVFTGSKFAKRLSIFGGNKKDKDTNEDERTPNKEGLEKQDVGVISDGEVILSPVKEEGHGEKSFFSRLGGNKKDNLEPNEVDYQHLLDKMRK